MVTLSGTLVRAALRPGERQVIGYSCGVLCAVDDPPGYGFRLVGLLVNGVARVIELPGYTKDDAVIVARMWANYPEILEEEVLAHLVGVDGATVTVTLEIEATMPGGAPENVVRTVTQNGRDLKFTSGGFEAE